MSNSRRTGFAPVRTSLTGWKLVLLLVLLTGCGQEMASQSRVDPQEASPVVEGQPSSRQLPAHVVAADASTYIGVSEEPKRPELSTADRIALVTGKEDGKLLEQVPASVLASRSYSALLRRGQERFNISCMPCHDATGSGNGMAVRRGFPYPPTYHSERLRSMPVGYFFVQATMGGDKMPPFGDLVSTEDRWAIAAYVRALQFSQFAPLDKLENEDRSKLEAVE